MFLQYTRTNDPTRNIKPSICNSEQPLKNYKLCLYYSYKLYVTLHYTSRARFVGHGDWNIKGLYILWHYLYYITLSFMFNLKCLFWNLLNSTKKSFGLIKIKWNPFILKRAWVVHFTNIILASELPVKIYEFEIKEVTQAIDYKL